MTGDTGGQGESPGTMTTLSSPGGAWWSTDTENPRCGQNIALCYYNFVMHTQGPNRAPSCGNSFHEPRLLVTFDPVTRAWAELVTSGQVTHHV